MKNLIRLFCFVVLLVLPFALLAQDPSAVTSGGFFAKVKAWGIDQMFGILVGWVSLFLGRKGYLKIIKLGAQKVETVSVQLSEFFSELGLMASKVDDAIKDDNTVDQNSLKEAIEAGKHVIVEGKDVIISIKPKT